LISSRIFGRKVFSSHAARIVQALVVAGAICLSTGVTDSEARFNKVGSRLMCTCGCAQSLMGCDHVGCPNRSGEMDRLRGGIAGGLSDAAILQGFVTEYGKTVLGAPPTEGFDLLAWIMPFAVALIGLLGTIFLVRHWAKSQPKPVPAGKMTQAEVRENEDMQERIRRETGTL
jgi:cytochrome c-type biogenesis protein CcmH/NrfF